MERWRKDTEQFTGTKENNWEAKQATFKKKKVNMLIRII